MNNKKLQQSIESTCQKAKDLEAICAQLSGGFYKEEGSSSNRAFNGLMYFHMIGWKINHDLHILSQENIPKEDPLAEAIVRGAKIPVFIKSADLNPPFSSNIADYRDSVFNLVSGSDPVTIYERFITNFASGIHFPTHVPTNQKNPVFSYLMYLFLDTYEPFFDYWTGFKSFTEKTQWPIDENTRRKTKHFMKHAQQLSEFDIEGLLEGYVDIIGEIGGIPKNERRKLLTREMMWHITKSNNEGEEEYTVDEEQYKRVMHLRDDLVHAFQYSSRWDTNTVFKSLANFFFESNPWNYLTYFETENDHRGGAKIYPSKRRDEPVYFDYNRNLLIIDEWMSRILKRDPTSNLVLTGKPGTGKTTALIQVAKNHNIKVIHVSTETIACDCLPSIIRQIRPMEQYAFVIYFDNVDIPESNTGNDWEIRKFVNNLERQSEGSTAVGNHVKFAMSTSTYERLSPPLKQRFYMKVDFPNPNIEQQRHIIDAHMKNMNIKGDIDDVLKRAYETDSLDKISKDSWKTPRQLKDAVVAYSFHYDYKGA